MMNGWVVRERVDELMKEEKMVEGGWWMGMAGALGRQGELNDAEGCSAPGMIGWTGLAPEECLRDRA